MKYIYNDIDLKWYIYMHHQDYGQLSEEVWMVDTLQFPIHTNQSTSFESDSSGLLQMAFWDCGGFKQIALCRFQSSRWQSWLQYLSKSIKVQSLNQLWFDKTT